MFSLTKITIKIVYSIGITYGNYLLNRSFFTSSISCSKYIIKPCIISSNSEERVSNNFFLHLKFSTSKVKASVAFSVFLPTLSPDLLWNRSGIRSRWIGVISQVSFLKKRKDLQTMFVITFIARQRTCGWSFSRFVLIPEERRNKTYNTRQERMARASKVWSW